MTVVVLVGPILQRLQEDKKIMASGDEQIAKIWTEI